MATIDYKQKIKDYMNSSEVDTLYKSMLNNLFPELMESDDEKIRKGIIRNLEYLMDRAEGFVKDELKERIAWLEKKPSLLTKEKALKKSPFVEQKPVDKKGMNLVEEEMTPFQKEVFCIIDTTIEEEQGLKQVCDKLIALASNEIKQKSSWSEEDEQTFIKSVEALEDSYNFMLADWLKEHKNQFLKPQNTWKPSDEQMVTLEYYMHTLVCNSYKETLFSLYQDLKKLREE